MNCSTREVQDYNQCLIEDLRQRNLELQNETSGRHSTIGADGHRWYWKNKREKTWEEFEDDNNDKLERKWCKRKIFAHVQADRNWQQVTFASMKMQILNFPDETEVKRSGSKPVYEGFESSEVSGARSSLKPPISQGERKQEQQRSRKIGERRSDPDGSDIDSEQYDEGGSSPIKESVAFSACTSNSDLICQDDEQAYVDTSDDDRDKSKLMKRNKKNNREKDTMKPFRNRDDKQRHDYEGERKFEQQIVRKGGDDRSDPDGSDTDHEKCYTEIPPPTDKGVMSLPDRSTSGDQDHQCLLREADFFPSDDDRDESKPGRRNKKKDGEKDKRHKNGKQKDDKPDKRTDAEHVKRCGYVRRVLFKTDTDVAIDVALIMFNSDVAEYCPKLYFFPRDRDDEKIQLKLVGANFKKKDLKFATGKMFKQQDKKVELGNKVMKCGIMTGLSVGALAFGDNRSQAQVKVTDAQCQVTVNSNVFILKGQMVVERRVEKAFFQAGDSGSAVFVRTGDSFECLGIAIGGMTSSSDTLVTPIGNVLRALKEQSQGASRMQEYKLKAFV